MQLPNIILIISFLSEIIPAISKLSEKYVTPLRFWLGARFVLFFDQPKDVEIILNSKQSGNKGDLYQYVSKCLGGVGLFSSQGIIPLNCEVDTFS